MPIKTEAEIEAKLIQKLQGLGYGKVTINNANDLRQNLRRQLDKLNAAELEDTLLTDNEFQFILTYLKKGIKVFEKAERLREWLPVKRANGKAIHIKFLNIQRWCKNYFQIAHQITQTDRLPNRYDVTLLINGLPLVQIELKRSGIEIKEAFKQINRYRRDSYAGEDGLFQYVQLFVISNNVNTKYYANNDGGINFKNTSFWADKKNNLMTSLDNFVSEFLKPCHVSKMICRYTVLTTANQLMVLRPYQYHAAEAIVEMVETNPTRNGYVWHTTGSGKTLTSFKAAQILCDMEKIEKVVFVVDRRDLDYQTTIEFNRFSEGSVDSTTNTNKLVSQFFDVNAKLIVTTIQKLNNAIQRENYLMKMQPLQDKRMVFIFDECHRSQFGDTHTRIKEFFKNKQMIGFTGTPIFQDNHIKVKSKNMQVRFETTEGLFGAPLHKYVITDAIADDNVLPFSVEYAGVSGASESVATDDKKRLETIADYIIKDYPKKTRNKNFNAIFCVPSIETLTRYYDIFKEKKHHLKVATIFSCSANEEENDSDIIEDAPQEIPVNSKEKLNSYIEDYNKLFKTNFSARDAKSFYAYYTDIAKRVKNKEIDLLLVVNMFLTGFDSVTLNTLYVDKNLKHQGLLQAFSRTNRIYNEIKSHGNIVCFRNLKQATDDAIILFANEKAIGQVLVQDYSHYVTEYNKAYDALKQLVPTIGDIDTIQEEEKQVEFVKAFRDLMRFHNILSGFSDFEQKHLRGSIEEYQGYKTKYIDIYDRAKDDDNDEYTLKQLDFEMELLHSDEINVSYILKLVANTDDKDSKGREKIFSLINTNLKLRSKRQIIENFMNQRMKPDNDIEENIEEEFGLFLRDEKEREFLLLCETEKLDKTKIKKLIADYHYYGEKPLDTEIAKSFIENLKFLERREKVKKTWKLLYEFIQKFE